jgi:hypothetical protein
LEDGTSWWSIAGSYLGGVVKERVCRRPSLRVGTALAAATLGITAVPLALFASLTPASASGTSVTIVISKPSDVAQQLESAFAAHHVKIAVVERPVAPDRVGSILSLSVDNSGHGAVAVSEIHGRCVGGGSGCVVGLVLPLHYSGVVRVTLGTATTSKFVRHAG